MTRTQTLIQSLTLALFAVVLAFAMPVAAWNGYNNNNHYNHDWDDNNDRTPTCWIKVSPNTVSYYGGTVNFSWDSTDAEWAEITGIGVVPTDGSLKVNVYESKTYRMTVHNGSRSAECDTFVNVVGQISSNNNYPTYYNNQYYVQQPYVALTQIPYTGFDFGPLGNAIYWMTLATIAIGGAYLLVYQSGMRALASIPAVNEIVRAGRGQIRAMRNLGRVENATPSAQSAAAPVVTLASTRIGGDMMEVVEGETPRIVITRN